MARSRCTIIDCTRIPAPCLSRNNPRADPRNSSYTPHKSRGSIFGGDAEGSRGYKEQTWGYLGEGSRGEEEWGGGTAAHSGEGQRRQTTYTAREWRQRVHLAASVCAARPVRVAGRGAGLLFLFRDQR